MPSTNQPPNLQDIVGRLSNRIHDRERTTRPTSRPGREEIAIFSVVGDMEVSTSGKYRVRSGGQIVAVYFDSEGGATGDTEFDILVDGSAVGSSVTIDSADDEDSVYIGDVRAGRGSRMQIDLTAAGMHEDAVIQVVMKS